MRLSGTAICPRCNKKFDWWKITCGKGEVVFFVGEKTLCNNVVDCHREYNGDGYSITVECEECDYRFKVKEHKEEE